MRIARCVTSTSVSVILLRPPADDQAPTVEKRAEEILARLRKGEPFADLAKSFSADSHAKDGGLWKNVKPEEAFRPEIAAAIDKLVVGETSPLLNLDCWGFIVKKIGQTKERKRSFAEAYEETVLVDLRYYRLPVSELLKEESFDDILILYSINNFMEDANIVRLE